MPGEEDVYSSVLKLFSIKLDSTPCQVKQGRRTGLCMFRGP